MLRSQEADGDDHAEVETTPIAVLHRFDVLFGKQANAREHTGTRRALHLVEMYYDEYEKRSKYQKTDVAEKIIAIIHESGGRFLKQGRKGEWIEADNDEARRKIGHWFRHARSKRRLQKGTEPVHPGEQVSSNEEMRKRAASFKRVTPSPTLEETGCGVSLQSFHCTTESIHRAKRPLRSV